MSTESLMTFIEGLSKDLESPSADTRLSYNLRTHTFVYSEDMFIEEFIAEMAAKEIKSAALNTYIRKIAPNMTSTLRTTLESMTLKANGGQKQGVAAKVVERNGIISFVFTTNIRTGLPPNKWAQGQKDVFDKIKRAYHKGYSAFFHGVRGHLTKKAEKSEGGMGRSEKFEKAYASKDGKRLYKGRAMHSGHKMGQGVVETRMREAFDKHKKKVMKKTEPLECLAETDLIADLKTLGIDLKFMRDPETGVMEFEISMEGATGNILRGAEMKKKLNDIRKRLKELLTGGAEGLELYQLKGSDSLLLVDRKTIINSIAKSYKKNKYVTVRTENTKKKARKKTVSKKIDGANVERGGRGKIAEPTLPAGAATASAGEQPKFNIQNILGLVNAQLQDRVGAKMVDPRLESRTGRFLESVRATDVTQTAQGYPSVGYTYARDPYEVYETGSGTRFASAYRDPRVIIDQSIREIVSQFGLGRMYTRRQ
tara:strand:- start:492 stop:1937 length:1446 start_codon:yes stop_codon:yes gene_type:complete